LIELVERAPTLPESQDKRTNCRGRPLQPFCFLLTVTFNFLDCRCVWRAFNGWIWTNHTQKTLSCDTTQNNANLHRPGGPDFYINLRNNTNRHGPGGQTAYDDPAEADPCFAKVIQGFDTLQRIHGAPVKEGDYNALVSNVAIVSMKVIDYQQEEDPDQPGQEEQADESGDGENEEEE
jgi:hypothetical protein